MGIAETKKEILDLLPEGELYTYKPVSVVQEQDGICGHSPEIDVLDVQALARSHDALLETCRDFIAASSSENVEDMGQSYLRLVRVVAEGEK